MWRTAAWGRLGQRNTKERGKRKLAGKEGIGKGGKVNVFKQYHCNYLWKGREGRREGREGNEGTGRAFDVKAASTKGNAVYFEVKSFFNYYDISG